MKKHVLTLAFMAFAGAVGATAAEAQEERAAGLFAALDADKSGDISLEEFLAAVPQRLSGADTDGDGKMTVAEIAATFDGADAQAQAQRFVERFDADKDGAMTLAEVETRRRDRFARIDGNSDGKVTLDELPATASGKGDRPKKTSVE